jgi:hypothetical protein
LAAVALAAATLVAGEAPAAMSAAAAAAAAAAWQQRPRPRRRQRFQMENNATIIPIFKSLEALAKESIQKRKKAENVYFYLRHKICNIANLALIFSNARSGTIANKNQKRIMAGTDYDIKWRVIREWRQQQDHDRKEKVCA